MASRVGLAHVAAVSFLAARLAPSGAFWFALAGGAAIAREADLRGVRTAYATSTAAMLQTVAIVGPLRFSAPLTQALSAPLLGWMHARGRRWLTMFAVCLTIRLALYAALTAFTLFVLLGTKAYQGSFDAVLGWLPFLPHGLAGALLLTGMVNLASGVFFSIVQVGLYRRALSTWPPRSLQPPNPRPAAPPATVEAGRVDPRTALASAAAITVVLLVSHSWVVLAAVTAWLAAASIFARHGDREVVRIGLWLALTLAAGTLIASLVGGLGVDEAASRTVRAGLLVLVATWMRVAAGSAGLREAFRRGLLRIHYLPGARDAAQLLGDLDSGSLLAGSATALQERLRGVPRRPLPVADAVLAWAAQEADAIAPYPSSATSAGMRLRLQLRDVTLAASVLLPAGALMAVLGS
jgi:hypothetical protein